MGDELRKEYWDGATWVYEATLLNGAGAGTILAVIASSAGEEMELLYGMLQNQDTSTRNASVVIEDDSGENLVFFLNADAITAGGTASFPTTEENIVRGAGGQRYFISGTQQLNVTIVSVGGSQDMRVAVAMRIRSAVPTVTATVSSGGSETVRSERIF